MLTNGAAQLSLLFLTR